jgi:hypothetical protein
VIELYPTDKLISTIDEYLDSCYINEEERRTFYEYLNNLITQFERSKFRRGYFEQKKILQQYEEKLNGLYNYNKEKKLIFYSSLVLVLIRRNIGNLPKMNYPLEIINNFLEEFKRIATKNMFNSMLSYVDLISNDKFLKDLALSRMILLPVGPQLLETGNLPLKTLYSGGPRQLLLVYRYLLFELRGITPYYKMKMHQLDPLLISKFNYNGWLKMLNLCARLLIINKDIKGLTGTSWFFDPQLVLLNDEMSYIHTLFKERGALFFKQKSSPNVIKDALFLSKTRKTLFEKGEYFPTEYIMIISRNNILANEKID